MIGESSCVALASQHAGAPLRPRAWNAPAGRGLSARPHHLNTRASNRYGRCRLGLRSVEKAVSPTASALLSPTGVLLAPSESCAIKVGRPRLGGFRNLPPPAGAVATACRSPHRGFICLRAAFLVPFGAVPQSAASLRGPRPFAPSSGGPRPSSSRPLPTVAPPPRWSGAGDIGVPLRGAFCRLTPCLLYGAWGLSPPRPSGGGLALLRSRRAPLLAHDAPFASLISPPSVRCVLATLVRSPVLVGKAPAQFCGYSKTRYTV